MKRKDAVPIRDILKDIIKEPKLERKLLEAKIINAWGDILGKSIENSTKKIYIHNRKLFVELKSAVVRNELMMMRTAILQRLNQIAGSRIIDEIILR